MSSLQITKRIPQITEKKIIVNMKVNDNNLNSVLHSLTAIITILQKIGQIEISLKLEKIREELLDGIEEK